MARSLLMIALLVVASPAIAFGQHLESAAPLPAALATVTLGADALSGAGGTLLIVLLTLGAVILIRKFGALE